MRPLQGIQKQDIFFLGRLNELVDFDRVAGLVVAKLPSAVISDAELGAPLHQLALFWGLGLLESLNVSRLMAAPPALEGDYINT